MKGLANDCLWKQACQCIQRSYFEIHSVLVDILYDSNHLSWGMLCSLTNDFYDHHISSFVILLKGLSRFLLINVRLKLS